MRQLTLPCDSNTIRWDLLFYDPIVHSSIMFRKTQVVQAAGLYYESFKYAQDWEYLSRIAYTLPYAGITNIGDYLLRYQLHSQSMTDTYGRIVDDEDPRIRIRNVCNLLGWNLSSNFDEHKRIIVNMRSMLFKAEENLSTRDLSTASEDVLRLNKAFCQKYQLADDEQKLHTVSVYFRVANTNCEKDEIVEALKFIKSALLLKPSSALNRSFILLLYKIILKKFVAFTRPLWIMLPDSMRARIRKMIKVKANIYKNH